MGTITTKKFVHQHAFQLQLPPRFIYIQINPRIHNKKMLRIQCGRNGTESNKTNKNRHRRENERKNRGDYPRNVNKWLIARICTSNIRMHTLKLCA